MRSDPVFAKRVQAQLNQHYNRKNESRNAQMLKYFSQPRDSNPRTNAGGLISTSPTNYNNEDSSISLHQNLTLPMTPQQPSTPQTLQASHRVGRNRRESQNNSDV